MENASKALIIAGAILISILLISVGILIMNSTDGMQDSMQSSMSQQEIEAFNSPFLTYESTSQTATNVKALLGKIAASNTTHDADDSDDQMYIELDATINGQTYTAKDIDSARAAVSSTKRYSVSCTVNGSTGLVNKVTITTN